MPERELSAAGIEVRSVLEQIWNQLTAAPRSAERNLASTDIPMRTAVGPLRLAVDSAGLRHLLVPLPTGSESVDDKRSSGVQLSTRNLVLGDGPIRFADLHCMRADLAGVFTGLVADICLYLQPTELQPGHLVGTMLESWRELLAIRHAAWTTERLAGLAGELLVLEQLLALDPTAGDCWTGPFGTAQDFSRGVNAIEVKTTLSRDGRLARIHGLDQLEPPRHGNLALCWNRLALVDSTQGDSIPDLIGRCLAVGGGAALTKALDELRLPAGDGAELTDFAFVRTESRWYVVDEDFPSLHPGRFVDSVVPAGVGNVEYVIDLDTARPSMHEDSLVARFLGRLS